MNNLEENNSNFVRFSAQLKTLGTELCNSRKASGQTQEQIADWLKCDRRYIMSIENGISFNFEIICLYCERMSIELNLTFKVD